MPKEEKIERVSELREDINKSSALLLTDYRGLTVKEISALRRSLREAGAEYKVVKNTLFELASKDTLDPQIAQMLEGPTAVAFIYDDPIAPAKAIADFMRDHKALSIKGGVVEGHFYGGDQIQALSKIPPKEVLIAQMLGAMQSPIAGFVGTLQGLMSNLVYTLQAVSDQKAA